MHVKYRSAKTAHRELARLAQGQAGYFTARQAAELRYKYPHLDYHVGAGNFERVGHGLYRLPGIPLAEHDDRPQAVASHQTALAVHELCDLLPAKIHLTVPRSFRKSPGKAQQLAEKIHAYTKPWTDRPNTRQRFRRSGAIAHGRLAGGGGDPRCGAATFELRGTHPVPEELPLPPEARRPAYDEMADQAELRPVDMKEGFRLLVDFHTRVNVGLRNDHPLLETFRASAELSNLGSPLAEPEICFNHTSRP